LRVIKKKKKKKKRITHLRLEKGVREQDREISSHSHGGISSSSSLLLSSLELSDTKVYEP